ncbi:UNVERIFIED_CONTAM: hypothetical protein HDU68_007078, partial [Siphonaria sp. JEL0065]
MQQTLVTKDGTQLSILIQGTHVPNTNPIVFFGPGPGFPVHHESGALQTAFGLDMSKQLLLLPDWRGCGNTSTTPEITFSLMVSDILEILEWIHKQYSASVTAIGVSVGSTCLLTAASINPTRFHRVIALATDIDFAGNDINMESFLEKEAATNSALVAALGKMGKVPIVSSTAFQTRAEWLIRLGVMQTGLTWSSSLWNTVTGLICTYGLFGMMSAVKNMSIVQDLMLPQMAALKIGELTIDSSVSVVLVHGGEDVVSPVKFVEDWFEGGLTSGNKKLVVIPGMRHMPHYEAPEEIRKSSKTASPEDYALIFRIMLNAVIPICCDAFFCDAEQAARTSLLSVFSRINEVEATISPESPQALSNAVKLCFEEYLIAFLAAEFLAAKNDYIAISRACVVVLNTVDWSVGVSVIGKRLEDTVVALCGLLERIKGRIDLGLTGDALLLSQKTRACNDVLKTIAALFAKLGGDSPSSTKAFEFLKQDRSRAKEGQALLIQSIQITFSDPKIYFRDCQFMAGIVAGWMLEISYGGKSGRNSWISPVFFATSSNPAGVAITALKKFVANASVELDGFYSLLCFFRGILSTIGADATAIEHGNISWYSELYKKIINVIDEATDSATRVLAFQTLATWMNVLKDSLTIGNPVPAGIEIVSVFKTSFDLVFTFWEDPVDSTQHKLKDIFIALLEIIQFFKKSETEAEASFLFEIVDNLLEADWLRKVKYDLLTYLLAVVEPDEILKLRGDFLTVCFDVMSNLSMSSRICSFLNRFFSNLFTKQQSLDPQSCTIWLTPFCYALSHPSSNLRRAVSENLLGLVFKDKKAHFKLLLSAFQTATTNASTALINMDFHIHGSICILKTGRSLGFIENDFLGSANVFTNRVVQSAISHPDSIIRTDVCGLLCDASRALAEPGIEELEFVKMFLSVNGSDHRSEFRQKLFGNIHKLIFRIRKCLYANQRDLKTKQAFVAKKTGTVEAQEDAEQEIGEINDRISIKMEFLNWLMEFAVISLSPGSSFPRTTSALVLLTTIRDAEELSLDSTFNKNLSAEFSTFNNASCAAALASILLNDTYEPSRQSAFGLLMSMKGEIPGFGQVEIQEFVDQGLKMLFSVKASDSDGGAFVFRVVFSKYVLDGGKYFRVSEDFEAINRVHSPSAAFVYQLLSLLGKHTSINEENLSDSITDFPMHGLFGALRAVLGEIKYINIKTVQEKKSWNAVLRQTATLVYQATKCVLAVLSNESPEGNYPGLNEEGSNEMNVDAVLADAGGEKTSKSQRILHECFRTVKEACGALEVVLCRPPLPVDEQKQDEVLDNEMIVNGGDWLRMLLTSIRHYGAFSGVFTCFSTLCAMLLCSKKQFLVSLPQTWLNDFLRKAEIMDVSITRRSGGLPLGVLAVLGSASPYRSTLVDETMKRLFKMAREDVPADANTNLDLPQVHAFNIIRRLLQDATITDLMRNYFADCFVLSIDGLSSSSFPIRNCATMLFSALVTKVIGVKKSREQDHSINTVSGREFFARFPSLHAFMMAKLSFAVSELNGENHAVHPAFYPILTILARLKPTALEGNNTHLTLSTFRPLVEKCACSSFFKVREITARAYSALIPATEFTETVVRLLTGLENKTEHYNEVHGRLLIVQNLIQLHLLKETPVKEIAVDFMDKIQSAVGSTIWILSECHIPAIQDVFVLILQDIFVSAKDILQLQTSLLKTVWTLAVQLIGETNSQRVKRGHAWTFHLRQNLAHFILDSLAGLSDASATDIILYFLNDTEYEVQSQALVYLQGCSETQELDWMRIVPKLVSLVHTKTTYQQVSYTAANICCLSHVQPFLHTTKISSQVHAVVSISEDFAERLSVTENTYEVEAILPLLALITMNGVGGFTNDGVNVLIGLMKKWSHEDTAVYVRVSVAKALSLVLPKFSINSEQGESIYVEMLLHLDVLLDDDDCDVRDAAAEIVSVHLNCKEPMIPVQCRASLFTHAIKTIKSSQGVSKVAMYIHRLLVGAIDTDTLLEAQINPTHVLFAKEESNQNKEEVVDTILSFRVLAA